MKKYSLEINQWSDADKQASIITKEHGTIIDTSGGGLFMPLFVTWKGTKEGEKLLRQAGVKVKEIPN
jgi:hypothetical protein